MPQKPKYELGEEVFLKCKVVKIEQSLGVDGIRMEPRYHVVMKDAKGPEVFDDVLFEKYLMSQRDVVAYEGMVAGEEED